MMFTKQKINTTNSNAFMKDKELKLAQEYKYLKVILNSALIFKSHIKKILNQLNSTFTTTNTFDHQWHLM